MKLTRASSYALHAMAHIVSLKQSVPIASHHIAEARGIPERFLLKVLRPLVDARILKSVKGPSGGYVLVRPAAELTVLDILEAVDGPMRGHTPFDKLDDNSPFNNRMEKICNQVADVTRKHLEKVKLTELSVK